MKLNDATLRYLWFDQGIIPGLVNAIINLGLGFLLFRDQSHIATWSVDKGAAADTIGTCFFLPLITCLIAIPIVRMHVAQGKVGRMEPIAGSSLTRRLGASSVLAAVVFGTASLIGFAPLVYLGYALFAGDEIAFGSFLLVKVSFAAALGVVVTPWIAYVALCDQSTSSHSRRT